MKLRNNPAYNKKKKMKSLGITVIKEVKYSHIEDCKTLIKETKGDPNKWENIL